MISVSVIIPVWNRAATIAPAIDSALAQRLPAASTAQVVVVDDGSTDDLAGALRPYGKRVICVRHERNMGAAAARNTGVAAAEGELVAFLDSDDAWLPDKLASQIAFMHEHGFAASCTAVRLVRAGLRETVWPRYATRELTFDDMVWGCIVSPGATLVCERVVFDEIGPLDPTMKRLEDWDWLLRYTRRQPLGFLAQPLAVVEPSDSQSFGHVAGAIEIMRARHMPGMAGARRRHFASALDVVCAAAEYHRGNILPSAWSLLKSLLRAPIGNPVLSAILHNRLGRA